MESFRALLQRNVLNTRLWRTRAELQYAITYWVEHTSNRRRRQRELGRLTPIEFELAVTSNTTHAAARVTQPVSIRPTAIPNFAIGILILGSHYAAGKGA